jgi:transcription elongation factor GreB
MSEKNYITPQGYKKLTDELNQLNRNERPQVCELVQWAAGNGDRSENADYQYGKKRLREIDRRIRFLLSRINAAIVIDPATLNSNKVQFGATVTVEDDDGLQKIWIIVGKDEINTQLGRISWLSPIGKALIGKQIGQTATIQTPQGEVNLEVRSIQYLTIT